MGTLKSLNVIEWGVKPDMPFEIARKTKLVNTFALLASGTTLPYLYIFFKSGVNIGLPVLFYFLALCFTFVLNKYGRYHFAKIWLYIFSHLYLFTASSALGKVSGEHLILIPVLLSAMLLFEFKEKKSLLFVVALNIATFVTLELTEFSVYSIPLSPDEERFLYYGSLLITLSAIIIMSIIYFQLYDRQIRKNKLMIKTGKEIEQTINYFSTSLFGKNSVDEILWDVSKNCIGRLGFVDCVIYLFDEKKRFLIQKAAYGAKNPEDFKIFKPLDIPLGEGIVGHVAKSGKPIIINDTSQDSRYIRDEEDRLSEIAVPLIYNGKVIGVIDSEHPQKNFYTERHLNVLKTISALCANKVSRAMADQEREKALKLQMEAEKIKAFDTLKSKLFANVSHELRTPLTLIMGTIDKHITSDETGDWSLLKRHTDRLLRLINQILDLTKLESRQFRLQPSPGDIVNFLKITISMFHSIAAARGIKTIADLPVQSLWLCFDHDALEKILFNLISNAIKFTRDETEINIGASYKEGILTLRVGDQGEGLSKPELKKVFDRYYQAGKKSSEGTGIGLALTKELVELHKGEITMTSELKKGTLVTVKLPLEKVGKPKMETDSIPSMQEQEDTIFEDQPDSSNMEKPLVLVIEDNVELAAYIRGELEPDLSVIQAFDGEQGISKACEKVPDLIISDLMMPKVDGIELCDQLKDNELTNHIPIILLTAKADMNSKLEGLRTGADEYMVKPFNSSELRTRSHNLIVQRKKLREKYSQLLSLGPEKIVITGTDEIFVKKLMAIIEDNISDHQFSVSELCRELGTSRMQLHRKLTSITGLSATAFIRQQRLHYASRLLESGDSVSQVAYASGFGSLSYFSKAFKEQFGVSPSEYSIQEM